MNSSFHSGPTAVVALAALLASCSDTAGPNACSVACDNTDPLPPGAPEVPVLTSFLDQVSVSPTLDLGWVPLEDFAPIVSPGSPVTMDRWFGDQCLVVGGIVRPVNEQEQNPNVPANERNYCDFPDTPYGTTTNGWFQGWSWHDVQTGQWSGDLPEHRFTLYQGSAFVSLPPTSFQVQGPYGVAWQYQKPMYVTHTLERWPSDSGGGNPYQDIQVAGIYPIKRIFNATLPITTQPFIRLRRYWRKEDTYGWVGDDLTRSQVLTTTIGQSETRIDRFMQTTKIGFSFAAERTTGVDVDGVTATNKVSAGFTWEHTTQQTQGIDVTIWEMRSIQDETTATCRANEECRIVLWVLVNQLDIVDKDGNAWRDYNVVPDTTSLTYTTESDQVTYLYRFPIAQ